MQYPIRGKRERSKERYGERGVFLFSRLSLEEGRMPSIGSRAEGGGTPRAVGGKGLGRVFPKIAGGRMALEEKR